MQIAISDININMMKMQTEVGRVLDAVVQLQVSEQNSKDKVTQLEEGRKMTDTRLDVMSKDIATEIASGKALRTIIEKKVNEDMRIIMKDLASTKLQCSHLTEEVASTTNAQKEDRETLQQAHLKIEGVLNEVKKSNTVTNIVENRLASTAKGVKANFKKASEMFNNFAKLNECYEKTKARIIDAEGVIKELGDAGKRTQHELEDAVRLQEATADRLQTVLKDMESAGNGTEELRHQVNALKTTGEGNSRRILKMAQELKEVEDATYQVRGALQEQSSMLLPNIHMDSQEAVASSERHGSLLMSHGARPGGGGSKGTPRTRNW